MVKKIKNMKVKLKLIFKNGGFIKGNFDIPTKDLKNIGLFQAIQKKVKCFNPEKILINHK